MSPITHFLAGWAVANSGKFRRRDRLLITFAAIIPDIDGVGVVADLFARNREHPFEFYQRCHHVFGHNLLFGLVMTVAAFLISGRRMMTAAFVLLSVHIHFLCDLAGSRGAGDDFWSVSYFRPFLDRDYFWAGQWPLNGWQNFLITGFLMLFTFYWSWKSGFSPLEMISAGVDQGFVRTLRERFGNPSKASASGVP